MTDDRGRRIADLVAETLKNHGLRHAFGMPGGEVVTLLDGLDKAGIAFHLARHETAAALMAAGASVRSGRPAALLTTLGPGLANAVNGIADAAQERIPLIVLSGIAEAAIRSRYTHQIIDHAALLRPLVKASFEITRDGAAETVARALRLAMSEPKGPVHLDIAPDVAASLTSDSALNPADIIRPELQACDPALKRLCDRIDRAERPVILAGFEAARYGAGLALQALAEKIGAPVMTTYKGKGILAESHPLSLGAAGLSPLADRMLLPLLKQADLVLAIGYDPIEMRIGWMDFAQPEAILEITALPGDHGMHQAGLRLECDPARALPALVGTVRGSDGWPDKAWHKVKTGLQQAFQPQADFGPSTIVALLQEAAGANGVVTVDSGAHRILLSQQWKSEAPLCLLQSAGFCTMAAALPLAIGIAASEPGQRIFAVMGDGGLEMGIGELATLRDLGRPVTIVLFQDQSLALIAAKQKSAGLPPLGVALGQTDFVAAARAFGGLGFNVETRDELRRALDGAANHQGFSLIACRFDARAYAGAF